VPVACNLTPLSTDHCVLHLGQVSSGIDYRHYFGLFGAVNVATIQCLRHMRRDTKASSVAGGGAPTAYRLQRRSAPSFWNCRAGPIEGERTTGKGRQRSRQRATLLGVDADMTSMTGLCQRGKRSPDALPEERGCKFFLILRRVCWSLGRGSSFCENQTSICWRSFCGRPED
jgi:hypothetical protein